MRYHPIASASLVTTLSIWGAAAGGAPGWKASGKGGAVAAGGAKAVLAGIAVLKAGGNAADAAAAAILALSVTDYGPFCIGGEVPLLIYDAKSKEVKVLCGQGRAPLDAEATAWFLAHGIPTSADKANLKSACVPAVIDLCATLLRAYGTMRYEDVVAPTLAILDEGRRKWHPNLAGTLRKLVAAERRFPRDRSKGLRAVADRFYRSDIADELDTWYRTHGGFLRKKDLAAHVTRVEDPVSVTYRGYTVYKCGPWTQGPALCQTLRLLEGFDLKSMGAGSADYVHVVCEAMKLALADRDQYYADPLFERVPLRQLLSDAYTRLRRPLIDMRHASLKIRPGDPLAGKALAKPDIRKAPAALGRDTTTCVVADRWGNVVAATPSGWGSKAGAGGSTGVTHGTRLISLNTWKGHPNCVQPGKRPRITLTPTLVTKGGKPILAISVAGGDLQDQTTLNLLLEFVEFGALPAEAVTAPRFATGHHVGSFSQTPPRRGSLSVHRGFDKKVRDDLRRRGHRLSVTRSGIGTPVMLAIDPKSGTIHVAGDPATRRHAAALDLPASPPAK